MKISGPFLSVDDPDSFFFMRGFPDFASHEPLKARFYEGELWKSELENILMPMLEKYEVVVVEDSEGLISLVVAYAIPVNSAALSSASQLALARHPQARSGSASPGRRPRSLRGRSLPQSL